MHVIRQVVYLSLALAMIMASCQQKTADPYIMTVKGPVSLSDAGFFLSHEHVMVDWIGADSTGYHRWDADSVIAVVLPYLQEISELGVNTFVDCTPAYLGRDPLILLELSTLTGLHLLTNTGYYGAANNRFIPSYAWDETAEQLASRWVEEAQNGIDRSGIRPGFIKIGVQFRDSLPELHEKLVRAAAITHRQTGLTIKSHTGGDHAAFAQLAIIQNEGVSPSAFIWTHAQGGSLEKQIEAAKMGVWVSLDAVNSTRGRDAERMGNLDWYVERLVDLKTAGVLDQILISHDAGWYNVGEPGGGRFRGYTDIHKYLLPALLANGFTQAEIDQLTIHNPARAFAVAVRICLQP